MLATGASLYVLLLLQGRQVGVAVDCDPERCRVPVHITYRHTNRVNQPTQGVRPASQALRTAGRSRDEGGSGSLDGAASQGARRPVPDPNLVFGRKKRPFVRVLLISA